MTAQPAHITQMEAQLRSLSLRTGAAHSQAEDGRAAEAKDSLADGYDTDRRSRRRRWTALTFLLLAGAAAGAYSTAPGQQLMAPYTEPLQTALAHLLPHTAEQAQPGAADAAPAQGAATPAAAQILPQTVAAPLPQMRQIIGSGYSRAEQDVILGAPLPGRIASVAFQEGDTVAKGAPLLQMEDRAAKEAVTSAQMALAQAQLDTEAAELSVAQLLDTQTRLDKLLARGAVTPTDANENAHSLAAARVKARQAALTEQAAKDALTSARADLADHVLKAPFDGIVAASNATPAMMVEGLQHDALLRLFDPASLVIDVDIAERSLSGISAGLGATVVFDAWPDQSFDGAVTAVAPVLSRERGTLRVSITLSDPPAALRPNMAARATLKMSRTLPDQP